MWLTKISLRRPVSVLMFFVTMTVIGAIATQRLPLEMFPDLEFPFLFVNVPYRNSTPEDVERRITRPVEEALATLEGVKRIRSESGENGAEIYMELGWDEDLAIKGVEARDKIDAIRGDLPEDLERIQVFKFSGSDQPMLVLRISADRDLSQAYDMLERNLKRRIERLPGVSKVELYGPVEKEVRIELSAERVANHGVDLLQLASMLRKANFSLTAGDFVEGGRLFYVKPEGRFKRLEDVEGMVINEQGLRLGDIADVQYTDPVLLQGRHLNRRFAVGLNVFRETGSNLVAVSERVLEEVEEIKQLPDMRGISLVLFEDQAASVKSSLADLAQAGLMGIVLSFVVLYLFLGDLRVTGIVTMAVPFSLMMTLGAMYFLGYSLNILSLMGLMLSVGMLVDNAVVVTESIYKARSEGGLNAYEATLAGVRNVGLAVSLGTLTTAIVFLPNLFGAQSEITVFLGQVAMTICVSLVASLLVAITLIPQLTTRVSMTSGKSPHWIAGLSERFTGWLGWSLRHRGWMSLLIVVTAASTAVPATFVKTEMFPQAGANRIFLDYGINGVYALDKVEEAVNTVEEFLYQNQDRFEMESVYSYYAQDEAQTLLYLHDDPDKRSKSSRELIEEMRPLLPKLAIGELAFEQNRSGGSDKLGVQVYGEGTAGLMDVARSVADILKRVDGLTDVRIDTGPTSWEVRVRVDRDRARKHGLSSQQVAEVVAGAMRGTELRPFRARDGEVEMVLQFRRSDRLDLDALRALPIITPSGERIALDTVADLSIGDVPSEVRRQQRRTALSVNFSTVEGVTAEDAKKRVDAIMETLSFPPGYGWGYGQAFDDEAEQLQSMLINMVLALVCIYLVMAALFESALAPAGIMSCILFSFVGVWWFFFFTGTQFSFMAMIGLLVLMGVVVNNGIVLIDHVHQLRRAGMPREQALIVGSRERLRPILMTAATTVFSMVPLALSDAAIGGGGPPYYPMARAVIGGLLFSTIVNLLWLPTIYLNLEDLANWVRRVLHKARGRHDDTDNPVGTLPLTANGGTDGNG